MTLGTLMARASEICVQAPERKGGDGIWTITRSADGVWTFELYTYALACGGRRVRWEGIEDPAEMVEALEAYIPILQQRLDEAVAAEQEGWW